MSIKPPEYHVVSFPEWIELCGLCGNRVWRLPPNGKVYCPVKGCEGYAPITYRKER
jgi:hypothetical protein